MAGRVTSPRPSRVVLYGIAPSPSPRFVTSSNSEEYDHEDMAVNKITLSDSEMRQLNAQ